MTLCEPSVCPIILLPVPPITDLPPAYPAELKYRCSSSYTRQLNYLQTNFINLHLEISISFEVCLKETFLNLSNYKL